MKIEYTEVDLNTIISFFSNSFVLKEDAKEKIFKKEWYVDPFKKVVVYKFYIDNEKNENIT